MRRRTLLAVAALTLLSAFAGAPAHAQSPAWQPTLEGKALLAALRAGGYILYFRHTSTDFGQNDEKMTGYEDCATQRNLTDAGRAEARAIGLELQRLAIPVGEVLASPFCRTRETAQLIFGRATVSTQVRGGPADTTGERYSELRALLSTPVTGRSNLAIASHGNPFYSLTRLSYLGEGEAAVIAPRGAEGFVVVARIRKDDWRGFEPVR
jgi:phosphohistidine phosphatase SixA